MTQPRGPSSSTPWRFIVGEVYRGRSVGRALMHLNVKSDVKMRGRVLDVGGGHRQTYLDFVSVPEAKELIVVDIQRTNAVDVVGSVTNMPLKSASVDTVLCFNLLEHVFDHKAALREIYRVMKPGAVLYGWVPFMIGVHGDPHDHYRYTGMTLDILLSETGLTPVKVENSGGVFLSAFDMVRPYIRCWLIGGILRVAGVVVALLATWLVSRVGYGSHRSLDPSACPSGVWLSPSDNDGKHIGFDNGLL